MSETPPPGPPPGPPATPPPAMPPPGTMPMAPPNNQKAIWSLVTGIMSIVCCGLGVVLGPVAIILGNGSKKEIAASGGAQGGSGMAQAGFILGIIGLILSLIAVLYYVLVVAAIFTAGSQLQLQQ